MGFTIDQVPKDIQELWCMEIAISIAPFGVGKATIKTYQDKREVLKKEYPEWFPKKGEEIFPTKNNSLK